MEQTAHIVIGMQYGDEGKGSWVDHLVERHDIPYVVRFNGGAQAAHHVVGPEGIVHRFAQFGAGTFRPNTRTILSRFMLVDPELMFVEAGELWRIGVTHAMERVLVSENAPVITPFNRVMNRIQETWRDGARHGSCGLGIGLTQKDVEEQGERALYARDLTSPHLRDKLEWLWDVRKREAEQYRSERTEDLLATLHDIDLGHYMGLFRRFASGVRIVGDDHISSLLRSNSVVFEGAQGVLLDQHVGFFPYCTRSTCSFENAETLLDEAGFDGAIERIGLVRAYASRHGAGPFVTESPLEIPACHNAENLWQGAFRVGWFDSVAVRYALEQVGRVDTLAVTNLDRLAGLHEVKVCERYRGGGGGFLDNRGARIVPISRSDFDRRTCLAEDLRVVQPEYRVAPPVRDEAAAMRYLDTIEELVDHSVAAYSFRPDSAKGYRSEVTCTSGTTAR